MDKILKTKWVKALLSGRYKQTQGQLRKHGAYCCLGVLCVVGRGKISSDGTSATYKGKTSGDTGDFLPTSFGLSSRKLERLVHMNDRKKATFKEIAAYIKAKL